MKLNFREISENLENTLNENLGSSYLINPFFRISKATPEQMKPYFMITHNFPRPLILMINLILIPWYALKLIIGLMLSIIFQNQYKSLNWNRHQQKNLFLSHGTAGNLLDEKKDRFFDLLPEKFITLGQASSMVVYTNQNNFRYKRDLKLLRQKNPNTDHVLLPKFLKFGENLYFILYISYLAFKCLCTGISIYLSDSTRSRILFASIPSFFRRNTYTNYLLRERMRDLYQSNSKFAFFLTFEGHIYEQMLSDDAIKRNAHVSIYLYQHSPLVPYHFGVINHLNHLDNKICILTTGIFYQKYLQSISSRPRYIVFGSNKVNISQSRSNVESNSILYVPEGTFKATFQILKLIHKLTDSLKDYTHVLRLHPDFKINIFAKILLRVLNKHSNFRLSSSNLSTDLKTSKFLLYRSSAVGIEALNYKTIPIFYANSKFNDLNVLFMDDTLYYQARDAVELISLINSQLSGTSLPKRENKLKELLTSLKYESII